MNSRHAPGAAPPQHGGRLRLAAARYGIPLSEWLDLSTGIHPAPWPAPPPPVSAWARLPEPEDGLLEAAQRYYRAASVLPAAGSQAAIQTLPALVAAERIGPSTQLRTGVLAPTYAEHAHAWRRLGYEPISLAAREIAGALATLDALVVVNPNNPTGERFAPETLLEWHAKLAARGGFLIVDEAFMDATPEQSLAPHAARPGLVVLRSLGKFFGLAGARVGFVLAAPDFLDALSRLLGPWTVSGPSRFAAIEALQDRPWQEAARAQLARESQRLAHVLSHHGLAPDGGTALFQWVCTPRASRIHEALARRGILSRLFDDPPSLRFGLPGSETDWARLGSALSDLGARAPDGVSA